jgi:transposase InsO family protein
VWATDITYIPMARGFLYLVAVMDWYSRYVLAWRLSNTHWAHLPIMDFAPPRVLAQPVRPGAGDDEIDPPAAAR